MQQPKKIHVATTVNGEPREFLCEPGQVLSDVLRNTLSLTGVKEGCTTGDCGACSVRLDGSLVCSCLVLAAEVEGSALLPGRLFSQIMAKLPDAAVDLDATGERVEVRCGRATFRVRSMPVPAVMIDGKPCTRTDYKF